MGKAARVILCCIAVSGCTSNPAIPTVVRVPVPVSCIKEAPVLPETRAEAEILALDEFAATITVWAERLALKAYSARAAAVIDACR